MAEVEASKDMSTQPVKVLSFYTVNTPYEQEVAHLRNSCENFGIPHIIEGISDLGSWEENVAFKPRYLLQKAEEGLAPFLWVDADGVFLQKPDFSIFEDFDFAVRKMEIFSEHREYAFNAATLFVGPGEAAIHLIRKWVLRSEELGPIPFVDQIALFDVLENEKIAKVLPLPVSYCKIYDMDQFFINDADVVIEQRQMSRSMR